MHTDYKNEGKYLYVDMYLHVHMYRYVYLNTYDYIHETYIARNPARVYI